jgi:hypothetical protein
MKLCYFYSLAACIAAFPSYAQEKMPVGDMGPWKQTFTEDFNKPVPLGGFTTDEYYLNKFDWYGGGIPDTAQQHEDDNVYSGYYPEEILEVKDGKLIKHLHTDAVKHDFEKGNAYVSKAAAISPMNKPEAERMDWYNTLYGKYTIRFRSDPLEGFKTAWLLWPQSEEWPEDGEIDFPEGHLNSTIMAAMHRQNGKSGGDQDLFYTETRFTEWNTASIEWMPGRVNFLLNDKLIGCSDERIPNTPMRWVVQTESCLPDCPDEGTSGTLEIDWMVMYEWNGAEAPDKCPKEL